MPLCRRENALASITVLEIQTVPRTHGVGSSLLGHDAPLVWCAAPCAVFGAHPDDNSTWNHYMPMVVPTRSCMR